MKGLERKNNIFFHQSCEISDGSNIGEGTVIWNNSQIRGNSKIGVNCTISKNVYIDKGVIVGDNVKIQNGVSLYDGMVIEDDVFLGPHSVYTNDLQPRAFNDQWQLTETLIRKGCSIGANATVVCGNVIGAYSMVAAGSVITNDVAPHSLVMGNPARLIGVVCTLGHKMEQVNKFDEQVLFKCAECNEDISFNLQVTK